ELGPLEAAQASKIAAKADARQSARKGAAYPSVQSVGQGRGVEIDGPRWLGEAVLFEEPFVYPTRAGGPRPASAHHRGPRVNVRPPLRLQFREILHSSGVVPEEVRPADAVILIDV